MTRTRSAARRLIVTADDFGASQAVNDAVEIAHRDGILTAASLMVTGGAAADAVARARTMPGLGVGLHLVLVEGRPALPAAAIPDLVDRSGSFRTDMVGAAITIFAKRSARRQLAAEIDAQFAGFAATGLGFDHVNAHKHFHLHPVIATAVLAAAHRYGVRAVRAPVEPRAVLRAAASDRQRPLPAAGVAGIAADWWARSLRARLRRAGMLVPDQVFGLAWSGRLETDLLRALVARLPPGLSEIYSHPATADDWTGHAAGYRYRAELAALTDPPVREIVGREGIVCGRFADFDRTPHLPESPMTTTRP